MKDGAKGQVLVMGLGASGVAAARLLQHQGRTVIVADEKADEARLRACFGDEPPRLVREVESLRPGELAFAVVSPGIAWEHRWLRQVRSLGVDVLPEFELGLAALPGVRVIAVTGTNGKSSLVKWIADAWSLSGVRAVPAGNYGTPPSELAVSRQPPDAVVLELSSFQLEQSVSFRPDVAVLLNLSPNHLDRHPTMEAYASAKARLFKAMDGRGASIIHRPAWPLIRPWVPEGLDVTWFGAEVSDGYSYRDGWVLARGKRLVDLRDTWWGRWPLGENAAAGVAALEAVGVPVPVMENSARDFVPLAHRMELVVTWNGVRYINDSKASTLSALAAAVGSGTARKHLIAGGILKEKDVNFVKETLAKNCSFVYCIGQAAQKLVSAWGEVVPCKDVGVLEEAVRAASARALPGEEVLLSPGCSSFDQFTSYAQRGEKFKQWVQQCTGKNINSV